MTRYGQIRHFIMSMKEGVDEGIGLMNEDPERSRRTLRAIIADLEMLEDLLNYWDAMDMGARFKATLQGLQTGKPGAGGPRGNFPPLMNRSAERSGP